MREKEPVPIPKTSAEQALLDEAQRRAKLEELDKIRIQSYKIKRDASLRGTPCPGRCGRRPTQGHHLWIRRPDHPYLQDPINIVLACPICNTDEPAGFQVQAALDQLWRYGPDMIEAYVEDWPGEAERHLPGFYFDALTLYEEGKKEAPR